MRTSSIGVAGTIILAISLLAPNASAELSKPQSLPVISVKAPKGTLRLQVAKTDKQREMGLMFVTSLPSNTGMVFAFENEASHSFWMKNTLIALDMIFVGEDEVIKQIYANVPIVSPKLPNPKIPRQRGVGKFVIELGANEANRVGLKPGIALHGLNSAIAQLAKTP